MKRILTYTCLLWIITVFADACKKESGSNASITNPVNEDYLSRIYFTSNDGSGEVLEGTKTYVFDNLKRVIKVIDSSSTVASNTIVPYTVTEYFYQGNDTLPYRSLDISNPSVQADFDTIINYYTYNNAGLLIRDSGYFAIYGSTSWAITRSNQTFSYSGTTITGRRDDTLTQPQGTFPATRIDTAQTDAYGNIVHNIKHKDFEDINSSITWDTHPSPFRKLSNFRSSFQFPFGETFFYELPQNNNRLHITEITTGGMPYTYEEDLTGNYTYNAAGYPMQILEPDSSIPGAYKKITFEYKSL